MPELEIEQEKTEIISRYRRLLRHAKPILKEGDAKLIKRAFYMSLEAHKNMRRRSGKPYIFSYYGSSRILGMDPYVGDIRTCALTCKI